MIAIGLHAVLDMPLSNGGEIPFVQIILTIIPWIIILVLISVGLKQISKLNTRKLLNNLLESEILLLCRTAKIKLKILSRWLHPIRNFLIILKSSTDANKINNVSIYTTFSIKI